MADRGYNYVPSNVKTDRVVFMKDFVRENGGVMVWKIAHTIVRILSHVQNFSGNSRSHMVYGV